MALGGTGTAEPSISISTVIRAEGSSADMAAKAARRNEPGNKS
jgi:hypothetical protein